MQNTHQLCSFLMVSRKGQSSCSLFLLSLRLFCVKFKAIIWEFLQPLRKWQILWFSQDFPLPCSHQLFTDFFKGFFSEFWLLQLYIKLHVKNFVTNTSPPSVGSFCRLVKKIKDELSFEMAKPGWFISITPISRSFPLENLSEYLKNTTDFYSAFPFFRQKRWKTTTFEVEVALQEEEDTFLIQTQVTEQFLKNTSHSCSNSCKNPSGEHPWVWFRALKIYWHFSVQSSCAGQGELWVWLDFLGFSLALSREQSPKCPFCWCVPGRRSRSRSRRRSHSKSRSRRRSKSPRRRRSHSRDRSRRSRSTSKTRWWLQSWAGQGLSPVPPTSASLFLYSRLGSAVWKWLKFNLSSAKRDKKKEEKEKKRSKTPPKSYSTTRRSRSTSRYRNGVFSLFSAGFWYTSILNRNKMLW